MNFQVSGFHPVHPVHNTGTLTPEPGSRRMNPISVLICDDSALMRRSLKRMVESDSRLKVIGTARDGVDAVNKARELHPDVVTMDVNMPGMDGITALQMILHEEIAPVLMVSSLTQDGAEVTFESLALGAFDYVPKPGGTVSLDIGKIQEEMISKIIAAARPGVMRRICRRKGDLSKSSDKSRRKSASGRKTEKAGDQKFRAVALGISTGGPRTLFDVLPELPADLAAPVFVVQHMPQKFTGPFVRRLNDYCKMECREAEPGMPVEPGTIYLARGGNHLTLYRKPEGNMVLRTPKKPDTTFIPSVNVMMQSVLHMFGADTVGVLMTGMGDDGADSMVDIRKAGGITIAESEETAVVFGMPRVAIERGGAEIIAPSWQIAKEIVRAVSGT